jgi:DNA invertase Pin-like site-specific DNA recombinase
MKTEIIRDHPSFESFRTWFAEQCADPKVGQEDIARELGISSCTVSELIRGLGITWVRRKQKKRIRKLKGQERIEDMARMRAKGISFRKIGIEYGVTRQCVQQTLIQAGYVTTRPQRSRVKRDGEQE